MTISGASQGTLLALYILGAFFPFCGAKVKVITLASSVVEALLLESSSVHGQAWRGGGMLPGCTGKLLIGLHIPY